MPYIDQARERFRIAISSCRRNFYLPSAPKATPQRLGFSLINCKASTMMDSSFEGMHKPIRSNVYTAIFLDERDKAR